MKLRNVKIHLLLILCLAIPLQGFAAAIAFGPPCAMESPAVGDAAAVSAEPMARDCCNDTDTFAKTGKMCKTGQACSAGSVYLVFPPTVFPLAAATTDRGALIEPFVYAMFSSGVWRPPTQL